jgi:hypothetical protein
MAAGVTSYERVQFKDYQAFLILPNLEAIGSCSFQKSASIWEILWYPVESYGM